jgi:ribulose kinase
LTWRTTASIVRAVHDGARTYRSRAALDRFYFAEIGLSDPPKTDSRIGAHVRVPGERAGAVTTEAAAARRQLGTPSRHPIDAHAGALGMLGAAATAPLERASRSSRVPVISRWRASGTTSPAWGPYYEAILLGMVHRSRSPRRASSTRCHASRRGRTR